MSNGTAAVVSQAQRRETTRRAILETAHALFAARGFEATSIDDIAAACGLAKGAVYHHFSSKGALFEQVLEAVQAGFAAQQAAAPPTERDPVRQVVAATQSYLVGSSEPGVRQILLIDGPAVIGWRRWREIDFRYFGTTTQQAVKRLLGPRSRGRDVEAVTHLLMGAVTEAALVCAGAQDPAREARVLARALGSMLEGLRHGA